MDIAAGVSSYHIYHLYADHLAAAGRNPEALEVLKSHPRVQTPDPASGGLVDYANTQAHVGHHFLAFGEPALSIPFYQRPAMAGSGASSELTSRMILARLDDRWEDALAEATYDYERYPSHKGMQERVRMLHVTGRHEEADELFGRNLAQAARDEIWTASSVGHKMGDSTVADMLATDVVGTSMQRPSAAMPGAGCS
jgi:hypothetical protein